MDFYQSYRLPLAEIEGALSMVNQSEVEELVDGILDSRRVFAVGVGRVQLMLHAFVKRLNHLGIPATYVGAIDEPAITDRDLLLVGSGSGESAFPSVIAEIARKHGAKIAHIGSNMQSRISAVADIKVRIPCKTKLSLPGEFDSKQPMSSLFEQCLLIFGDAVASMLSERKGIEISSLWRNHANLE